MIRKPQSDRACLVLVGRDRRARRSSRKSFIWIVLSRSTSHFSPVTSHSFRELGNAVDGVIDERSAGTPTKLSGFQNKMRRIFLIGVLCGVIMAAAVAFGRLIERYAHSPAAAAPDQFGSIRVHSWIASKQTIGTMPSFD
jgi:hypothetical protein